MIIWKAIPSYEGYYEVSNTGLVRSLDRYVKINNKSPRFQKGKELSQSNHKDGYKCVLLSLNGKQKLCTVHRLVAIAFLQQSPEKIEVNHKNGIKDDNNVNNLEWVTPSENMKHAYTMNRRYLSKPKGSESKSYKGDIHVYDLEGNFVMILKGATDMKAKGFDPSNVSRCLKSDTLSHRGYKFYRYNLE